MQTVDNLAEFAELRTILNFTQKLNKIHGMKNPYELKLEEDKLIALIEEGAELTKLLCIRLGSPIQCEMGFYILR